LIRPRGVVLAVIVEILLAFAINRLVGTPVQWAALIALPLAAVALLVLATPPGVEPAWAPPPEPPAVAAHLDASLLAGRLEDAVHDQSRFRSRVQPRLAALAVSALRRRPGLGDLTDLRDPRAAIELGPRWHAMLTDPAATMPEPAVVLALLERLEEQ
jgi:hypothetical protein